MNLLGKFLFFTFYYSTVFNFYVVCRISNERKCVDSECSVPISYATTLIRYIADDERILSFPPNAKAKVFSKEAGDKPTLWEVEINDKRGYVPNNLLKETKVLIKKDVKLINVSTGRDDKKNNATQETMTNLKPNPVSDTLELSPRNSKGLFSIIGGVSADSVPPSSPDINPQSAKKFQVFDGTTIYDVSNDENLDSSSEVVSEVKTEETPSIGNIQSTKETEIVEENLTEENTVETMKLDVKSEKVFVIKGEESIEQKLIDKNIDNVQPEIINSESSGSVSEPGILSGFIKGVTNLISSGNGENEEEEEDYSEEGEESSGEEENSEERSVIEENNLSDASETVIEETPENIKLHTVPMETTLPNKDMNLNYYETKTENVSEAYNFINTIINQTTNSNLKTDTISGLKKNEVTNKKPQHQNNLSTSMTGDENITHLLNEPKEMNENETNAELDSKIENLSTQNQEILKEEVLSKPTIVESDKTEPLENKRSFANSKDSQVSATQTKKSEAMSIFNSHLQKQQTEGLSEMVTGEGKMNSDSTHTILAMSVDEIINSNTSFDTSINSDSKDVDAKFPETVVGESKTSIAYEAFQSQPITDVPENIKLASEQSEQKTTEQTENSDIEIKQPTYSDGISGSDSSSANTNLDLKQHTDSHLSSTVENVFYTQNSKVSEREDINILEETIKRDYDGSEYTSISDLVDQVETTQESSIEETTEEKIEISVSENSLPIPSEDISTVTEVVEDIATQAVFNEPHEGMFSWFNAVFNIFTSSNSGQVGTEDMSNNINVLSESSDSLHTSHVKDESCLADGVGEQACETVKNIPLSKDFTWQESLYSTDMSLTVDLLDRIPLETTIWLVVTAVAVLIFSLGHYYIEAHRRDGPLVAVINKLEREVLILKKESCILEDRLHTAQEQLEAWNTNSSENDALIVELKQELEETKAAKLELEEQVAVLEREVESVTESGLEMHRLLSESLSSQDGSQVLLSTVETLREKLEHQEDEIVGLSQTLSHKNIEVEELQEKLNQSAEVASSLEVRIIEITREKEEEVFQLKDKRRTLIAQLEEMMETKALDETRVSAEMSKLRLAIEELQKSLAEKDSELEVVKEVVKQLRSTDSNDKMDALFDVVSVQARFKTAIAERDEYREKFQEEEGARKLLEGHMKKITQEVAELKNSFETAEKEKIEALTKLQVLSNYFKEKESQLQKELGLQESMWLQKQSDDHTIYEQMRSLREENEKYKLQNESLRKEIVEQESSFKIQLANVEQKSHENWVTSRQAERRLKEVQQEAAQLRNRLTMEKNSAYSLDDSKQNISHSESNGDPSSPPLSLIFPPTTSPPFMMYPMPPPGDFVPPPPLMGSPYPSDSRPPPLGRISSPPLDHRFSPPPPLPYPPYDYPSYGHHSPSPPPPLPPHSHHRNVHKPQPREMSREQKDHLMSNYSTETDKTIRRNKR